MNKKQSIRIDALHSRIINLEHGIQFLELQVETLEKSYNKLFGILIESGIIETDWKPTAPRGSSITANGRNNEPTYTKVNKVF